VSDYSPESHNQVFIDTRGKFAGMVGAELEEKPRRKAPFTNRRLQVHPLLSGYAAAEPFLYHSVHQASVIIKLDLLFTEPGGRSAALSVFLKETSEENKSYSGHRTPALKRRAASVSCPILSVHYRTFRVVAHFYGKGVFPNAFKLFGAG